MACANFYCNMNAITGQERRRYDLLRQKLMAAVQEQQETGTGYVFRLAEEAISAMDVMEWVSFERKCCPFFDFELVLERGGGPMWLRITGAEGAKEFMRAEFGLSGEQRPTR